MGAIAADLRLTPMKWQRRAVVSEFITCCLKYEAHIAWSTAVKKVRRNLVLRNRASLDLDVSCYSGRFQESKLPLAFGFPSPWLEKTRIRAFPQAAKIFKMTWDMIPAGLSTNQWLKEGKRWKKRRIGRGWDGAMVSHGERTQSDLFHWSDFQILISRVALRSSLISVLDANSGMSAHWLLHGGRSGSDSIGQKHP
jgi:hypothetical protein